jgi:hypothetical protein
LSLQHTGKLFLFFIKIDFLPVVAIIYFVIINVIWWVVSMIMGWQNKFWKSYFFVLGRIFGFCIVVFYLAFILTPLACGIYLTVTKNDLSYLHCGWVTVGLMLLAIYKKSYVIVRTYAIYKNGKVVGKYKTREKF